MNNNKRLAEALRRESMDNGWTFAPELGGGVDGVTFDVTDALPDLEGAYEVVAGYEDGMVAVVLSYAADMRHPEWVRHGGQVLDGFQRVGSVEDAAAWVLRWTDDVVTLLRERFRVADDGELVEVLG